MFVCSSLSIVFALLSVTEFTNLFVFGSIETTAKANHFFYGYSKNPINDFVGFRNYVKIQSEPLAYYSQESGEGNYEIGYGDYNYNGGQQITQIDKCPEAVERYDPDSMICYPVGSQGPCGPRMIFVSNEFTNPRDRSFGHCECDSESYDRPLVLLQGQCHFLYTQAICPPHYWLAMVDNLGAVCKLNPCSSPTHAASHFYDGSVTNYVEMNGKCVKLEGPSKYCSTEYEIVRFRRGRMQPSCELPEELSTTGPRRIFRRQITKVGFLACPPGAVRSTTSHKCHMMRKRFVIFDQDLEGSYYSSG